MEYRLASRPEWKVKSYTATVFKGQAALSCFEVWAGERRIASTINEANAHLIAAAVNACIKLNPDNPLAVAESINDMYEAFNDLMELQGINDGRVTVRACPSEDSILRAQKALAKAEGK